jgi:hypothetical protein
LSSSGQVTFTVSGGPADLVADLTGYYLPGTVTVAGGFVSHGVRVMDTRSGAGPVARARVASGHSVTLQVTGHNGVPAGVTAVGVSMSVVDPSVGGFLQVNATGSSARSTIINYARGQSISSFAVLPLSSSGQVTFTVSGGPADLVADLTGYYHK